MMLWQRPTAETIAGFIQKQSTQDWSYPEIGGTQTPTAPHGYTRDHYRIQLGDGDAAFEVARDAIRRWAMFDVGWVNIVPDPDPPGEGQTVGITFRMLGTWWLNACRVVYLVEEDGPPRRFGFAYGTLPDHIEQGEERFLVEQDADGVTWYDLSVFSRPRHLLARIGYPVARVMQRRFARHSQAAMQRTVQQALAATAPRRES